MVLARRIWGPEFVVICRTDITKGINLKRKLWALLDRQRLLARNLRVAIRHHLTV